MFQVARILAKRKDRAGAEEWYRKAAELGDTDAMNNLGLLLKRRDEPAEATRWYAPALKAGDNDPVLLYDYGRVLLDQGDLSGAEPHLRVAAKAGDSDATYLLGRLKEKDGKPEAAEKWYLLAAERKAAQRWYDKAVDAGTMIPFCFATPPAAGRDRQDRQGGGAAAQGRRVR